jgi:hypothetical protein
MYEGFPKRAGGVNRGGCPRASRCCCCSVTYSSPTALADSLFPVSPGKVIIYVGKRNDAAPQFTQKMGPTRSRSSTLKASRSRSAHESSAVIILAALIHWRNQVFGSRQLGARKTNSTNKRRAASSGLGPVTALDALRPSKNTYRIPPSISYSPVYFLCLISSDIGDRPVIVTASLCISFSYVCCQVTD